MVESGSQESEDQVVLEYSEEPSEGVEFRMVGSPIIESSQAESATLELSAPPQVVPSSVTPWRSVRERKPPNYYGFECNLTSVKEPESVTDAFKSQGWTHAMQTEMESLRDHDVWDLVPLPEGRKTIGSKWVF